MLTIISGGQTGVDQAALAVAWDLGYPTGGTAPLGYLTDQGPMPELLRDKYGPKESWSPSYRIRTIQNVKDGDFTVWFGDPDSPGGQLTIGTCRGKGNRPYRINPEAEVLLRLLTGEYAGIQVLNVAGNRLRTNPEAWQRASVILTSVLTDLCG